MVGSRKCGSVPLFIHPGLLVTPGTKQKASRRKAQLLGIASTVILLSSLLLAQQPDRTANIADAFGPSFVPATTIQSKVQEVDLVLSVTDRKGHFIHGLRRSDLAIYDNGKPQNEFTFFRNETNLPLRIALVVDISGSVTHRFVAEQGALKTFVKTIVRPSDSVALLAFNQRIELMAPVHKNENWKQISHRVKKLSPDGETALFDAVCGAVQWLAEDRGQARRVIILVTDGEENSSKVSLPQTIETALKAEVSIYSVNVSYETLGDDAQRGEQILKELSEGTGGAYLRSDSDGDVGWAFNKIRRELRNQYALAYKPLDLAAQSFHRVLVLAPRNLKVHCRPGYYVK